eukprot:GHVN01023859.1.p1 GENE.GHVN01023859.1~~GHVN01023859.1.p1  ORF type:complete len:437 (-),score=80.22 GHVN01023859.1:315-1625(-)
MEENRLNLAIDISQRATDLDRAGKYSEALDLYKKALDHWKLVWKYQPNPQLKEKLWNKMQEYISRAEQIKEYLNKEASKPIPITPEGEKPKPADGGKSEEDDKFRAALSSVISVDSPNVKWSDVAGLEAAKRALREAVDYPTRFPLLFGGELKPWKGILLYGPPGTGKTHLARACATEAKCTFLNVSSADLMSKWQGESEKLVRTLFEMARDKAPSIVFIDEVDSLVKSRSEGESESARRVKTEFLVQMDGVQTGGTTPAPQVLVLGATNVPWELDIGVRRRFEKRVYIPLPDAPARQKIFETAINKSPHSLRTEDFARLASMSDGFSGADVSIALRDVLFQPVRKCENATHFKRVRAKNPHTGNMEMFWCPCSPGDPDPSKKEMTFMEVPGKELLPPPLCLWDFETVMASARPSVRSEDLLKYGQWTNDFGTAGN